MVEVPLTQGKVALIDDEDAERVLAFKWGAHYNPTNKKWYARRNDWNGGRQRTIYLHRFLADAEEGALVDHINCDGLDNRRDNLRLASGIENQSNRRKQTNNSVGYKGVIFRKDEKSYQARCQVGRRVISSCFYKTAVEAARAYDDLARRLHGKFARLNFPHDDEQQA